MSRPFVYRPPNPPARRAGVLLLVLGGLALLVGVGLIAAGLNLPTLAQDPAMREKLDELRRQVPIGLEFVFVSYGVVALVYAAAALTLGLIVRVGGFVVMIVTLSAAAIVAAFAGLIALLAIAGGAPAGAVLPLGFAALHGLIVRWMIGGLRRTTPAPIDIIHRPMQDYYLPPVEPQKISIGT